MAFELERNEIWLGITDRGYFLTIKCSLASHFLMEIQMFFRKRRSLEGPRRKYCRYPWHWGERFRRWRWTFRTLGFWLSRIYRIQLCLFLYRKWWALMVWHWWGSCWKPCMSERASSWGCRFDGRQLQQWKRCHRNDGDPSQRCWNLWTSKWRRDHFWCRWTDFKLQRRVRHDSKIFVVLTCI